MAPVLGYARADRVDRTHRAGRDESPHSYGSSDSGRPRFVDRFRRGSEASTDAGALPAHETDGPRIEDFCLGTPRKVAQSHSGVVELYISLQENAVFLPTVKRRHRHRHHRRAEPGGNASHDQLPPEELDHDAAHEPDEEDDDEHAWPVGDGAPGAHEQPPPDLMTADGAAQHAQQAVQAARARAALAVEQARAAQAAATHPSPPASHAHAPSSRGPPSRRPSHPDSSPADAASHPGSAPGSAPGGGLSQSHSHTSTSSSDAPSGSTTGDAAAGDASHGTTNGPTSNGGSSNSNSHSHSTHSHGNSHSHGSNGHTAGGSRRSSHAQADTAHRAPTSSEDEDKQAGPCSTLRGSVLLKLAKPTKIKEIGVNFYCVSRTLWNLLPQPALFVDSALPNNAQVEDLAYLGIHRWDFVPLEQYGTAQGSYDRLNAGQSSTLIGQDLFGADAALLRDSPQEVRQRKFCRVYNSRVCRMRGDDEHKVPIFGPLSAQPRKLKQHNAQVDGVVFPAGSYVYNFTLLIDAKTPASVSVPNGQVRFVLGAKVVRAGAFTLNLNGHVDVDVVRAPQELSELAGSAPLNDAVLLSRMWEDSFVYSLNLEHRNITLDVPTKLTLTLMPLSDPTTKVHEIQVYALETITYIYSLDQSIRYVDPSMKLLLFQKDARSDPHGDRDSLLRATEPTTISTRIVLASEHNPSPRQSCAEPYHRGRYGELRFLEPDVKGPYIRVRHRLLVVLHVSRPVEGGGSHRRNRYEVKIDTPISVMSRHCVNDNISLPSYYALGGTTTSSDNDDFGDRDLPPSFDDAMEHQLLGPPGAPDANPRGTKACFTPSVGT